MDLGNRSGEFWGVIGESLADAEARLRSASRLLQLIQKEPFGVPDVKCAELANAIADLVHAADAVDARLLGIAAARLLPDAGPGEAD